MLTQSKAKGYKIASLEINGQTIGELLEKEWILTNNRGGYSSSTVVGCNTRRYHGLLIGSLTPPVNRIISLSTLGETLILNGKAYELSTFEFDGIFSPNGFGYLKKFKRYAGAYFKYQVKGVKIKKWVYLDPDSDRVFIEYDFGDFEGEAEFLLRPFISMRDFHELQSSTANLQMQHKDGGLLIDYPTENSCHLFLNCESLNFEQNEDWWYNFFYRKDKQRGQEFKEDLWTPGYYKGKITPDQKIAFGASLKLDYEGNDIGRGDLEDVKRRLIKNEDVLLRKAKAKESVHKKLVLASDQFVTKCRTEQSYRTTILAGFPWFADWGRDAFIALPGLLLSTRRYEEAKSVITTFAGAIDEGMVPNRFDDFSDTAHFNSIDASLWFVNASFEYLKASKDTDTFDRDILPAIESIIEKYQSGTRFNIHADKDGLIAGGSEETQLTWMDAKFGGVVFTPRFGKAVEINALWYNAICLLGEYFAETDVQKARFYHDLADKVEDSFCKQFWNDEKKYLNDCIFPDGMIDATLRPNQIFAVSLPFSPLSQRRQKLVVDTVKESLLTPYGLRTLNREDKRFVGFYGDGQDKRDSAYHQGTAWPYLTGAFVEAYIKVHDYSKKSREEAFGFIECLLSDMTDRGCLGSIAEIYDGDSPQNPKGCFAQAWSVSELLRSYLLIGL